MFKHFITCALLCSSLYAQSENVHGFLDVQLKNAYVTPRGLLVTEDGLTTQVLAGLEFDVFKDPGNTINKMSVTAWVWNDLWSEQDHRKVGSWNELDWGVGANWIVDEDWKVGVQFLQFVSPPHRFKNQNNVEFFLGYNDKNWDLPFVINPYAKLFWTVCGSSTVVTGKKHKTFDVELGVIPTFDFRDRDISLILTVPTWITVGPSEFWNGGKRGIKKEKSNFGVFSTGVKGEVPIAYVPDSYGNWYFNAGVQYYHLLNDNLLKAQKVTIDHVHDIHSAHRNIWVFSAGIGCRF